MADTKKSRDEQARNAENRQRERELEQARERIDEAEPPRDERGEANESRRARDESPDSARECHRRNCDEPAAFLVLERYLEETGHGAVEAEALLCREHTDEESPTNLDGVYEDYVFRVEPLPEIANADAS
ncbi:hypothetical protein DMJ13_24700 [halophilic archaeon]|nr:hypothetical protein DMJ13_24700 [halophilic archaeon]